MKARVYDGKKLGTVVDGAPVAIMAMLAPELIYFYEDEESQVTYQPALHTFVLARAQEDTNAGRMSLQMFVAVQAILVDYLKAVEQSRPSKPEQQTVWGKEARFGLWTALQRIAEGWKDHPEWRADW